MLSGSNTWCRPEIFYWHRDWSKIYAQKSMPTLTSNAWAKIFLVLTRPSLNSFSSFSVDGDAGKCKRNDVLCANVVIIIIRLSKRLASFATAVFPFARAKFPFLCDIIVSWAYVFNKHCSTFLSLLLFGNGHFLRCLTCISCCCGYFSHIPMENKSFSKYQAQMSKYKKLFIISVSCSSFSLILFASLSLFQWSVVFFLGPLHWGFMHIFVCVHIL